MCEVREPGGTVFGEQIRRILLDPASPEMSVRCEMMLYMASRAQLVEQTIAPALQRGELVLADRFISSTLAYQGAAGGLSPEEILAVGRIAVQSSWPDLTVIFDVDETTAARRLVGSAKDHRYIKVFGPTLFSDRLELRGAEYQQRVRKGYLQQAKDAPQRHLVIDSRNDPDSVFETLLNRLQERFA